MTTVNSPLLPDGTQQTSLRNVTNHTDPASPEPERWNQPRANAPKLLAVFWSFFIMGANDAAYGVRTR
jgi:hypothetical protein